jgi:hypothetical protein
MNVLSYRYGKKCEPWRTSESSVGLHADCRLCGQTESCCRCIMQDVKSVPTPASSRLVLRHIQLIWLQTPSGCGLAAVSQNQIFIIFYWYYYNNSVYNNDAVRSAHVM